MWSFIVNVPCLTTLLFDFTIFAFYWTKINIKWNWNRFLRSFVHWAWIANIWKDIDELSIYCSFPNLFSWNRVLQTCSKALQIFSSYDAFRRIFIFPRKNKSNAFQLANNSVVVAELYWNTVFDLVLLSSRYFINSNKVCEKCWIGGETIFCRNTKCNDIENYLLAFVWKIQRALLKQK